MFDLIPMLLSSVASFLFPIFASYKALRTGDPSQLTPWLMYWVVFNCCLLAESWLSWILIFIPFYGFFRLFFLLYLILPQTQGARVLYESRVHPFLQENEAHIDEFIAHAHSRLKHAGLGYVRRAIEYLRTTVLGLPPSPETSATSDPTAAASAAPQTYTQSLLARFSVPTARWSGMSSNTGGDFYNLLASAVSAATGAGGRLAAGAGDRAASGDMTASGTLIPPDLRNSADKMSFIAAQRERLNIILNALDHEAQQLQREGSTTPIEADDSAQRPPSGLSMWSALSKSRSEVDFEKIEAESGAEDDSTLRRRNPHHAGGGSSGSWIPWGWGAPNAGTSPEREE